MPALVQVSSIRVATERWAAVEEMDEVEMPSQH